MSLSDFIQESTRNPQNLPGILDLIRINAPFFFTDLSDVDKAKAGDTPWFNTTTHVEGAFPIDFTAVGNVLNSATDWAVIHDTVAPPVGTTSPRFPSTIHTSITGSFTIKSTDVLDTLGGDGLNRVVVTKMLVPGTITTEIVDLNGTTPVAISGDQSLCTFKDYESGSDGVNAGGVSMTDGTKCTAIMPASSNFSQESLVIIPDKYTAIFSEIICRADADATFFRLQTLGPVSKNFQQRTYISGTDLIIAKNFVFRGPGAVFVQGRSGTATPSCEVEFKGVMFKTNE